MRYRNEMKNPKLRRLRLRLGFTLVELMVVIALVAMLAGAVTLSVRSYLIKGKQNIAKVEISKFVQAIDSFTRHMIAILQTKKDSMYLLNLQTSLRKAC